MGLVVTRKPKEVIEIGDDITVTVVSVFGQSVKICIEAPREVVVNRQEIAERIRASKKG